MLLLILPGIAAIAAGMVWGIYFPINKHLWTSSFILLTGGMSLLFLALFYWIIDILGHHKWAFFFKVIGMNSLVIYLAYRFIDFGYTSRLLFSGYYHYAGAKWQPAWNALGALALVWIFLYILYRKKIFVRI